MQPAQQGSAPKNWKNAQTAFYLLCIFIFIQIIYLFLFLLLLLQVHTQRAGEEPVSKVLCYCALNCVLKMAALCDSGSACLTSGPGSIAT